jgi:hypothetical protein
MKGKRGLIDLTGKKFGRLTVLAIRSGIAIAGKPFPVGFAAVIAARKLLCPEGLCVRETQLAAAVLA